MTAALSKLKLHYFTVVKGSTTMGRGEYVRLLLEDSGIPYESVKFNAAQWKEEKQKLIELGIRSASMPYLTVDGKFYGKTVPSMRFISRKLGKYEGETDDEIHALDVYTDMVMDWTAKWAGALFSDNAETLNTYKTEYAPNSYKTWDQILSDTTGSYLLGEKISYADFALYHILEDDCEAKVNAEAYPHLAAFVEAIQNRPNIKKYLSTDRK